MAEGTAEGLKNAIFGAVHTEVWIFHRLNDELLRSLAMSALAVRRRLPCSSR
jgi:hypothetical protein